MTTTIIADLEADDAIGRTLAEAAAHLSGPALARIIERSPTTARRRLRGKGWTVSETFRLACALEMSPSELIATAPERAPLSLYDAAVIADALDVNIADVARLEPKDAKQ